ncbi:alpha/beta-hydrolase [Myriangium duriaei CBS 260.36]|uniref:Alpha/beta-hydrolase n=1 Tax=Myriangium duriaei CBS 260.36 TaxID=1168546 RepID=A0A9P4MKF1_9PEZI|nr:alpha/beta-hydrolase [Myriangium duriaei CBS 260.36]
MSVPLDVHIVLPSADHASTIIFLHGRDSDARTFSSEIFESESQSNLTLSELLPATKWVFPNAPLIPSMRFGCDMRQWFDMYSTEDPDERPDVQTPGLQENIRKIITIIEDECAMIGAHRVVVAGISQGAALLLHALLNLNQQVAGFVMLSSWLAVEEEARKLTDDESLHPLERQRSLARATGAGGQGWGLDFPVLIEHCSDDEIIRSENSLSLEQVLPQLGADVECHIYHDGGHWLNEPQGVDDFVGFVERVWNDSAGRNLASARSSGTPCTN